MPVGFTPTYTNKRQVLYDMAESSGKLDANTFNYLDTKNTTEADQYLTTLVATIGKTSDKFSQSDFDLLSGTEDQVTYLYHTYFQNPDDTLVDEKTGESQNLYSQTEEYLNTKLQQAREQKTYESLSGFEKTMATIGVMLGEVANAVYGTIENVLDALTLIGGAYADALTVGVFHKQIGEGTKWAISQDLTGTGAIAKELSDARRIYTDIDRNGFIKFLDDTFVGIAQMAPLFVPGGNVLYGLSMAGGTARDAINSNPDIDLASLAAYTGLVTAVEYGTEWLSGKLFGGVDFIGSKMLNAPMRKTGSFLKRVGLDFVSEAFEESLSEIIDGALDVWLVGGPDSHYASIQEVLYAGLIGGTIGALMTGGNILTTSRYAVTKEGDILRYRDLTKEQRTEVKRLSRIDTINLNESLQKANQAIRQDAVQEFTDKYAKQGLTVEQAREQHAKEYERAVQAKTENSKLISDAVSVLSKVMEWAGPDAFVNAAQLAQLTLEQRSELIRRYTDYSPSVNKLNAAVEMMIQNANPGSNAKVRTDLTAAQIKTQDAFKAMGINAYFVDYGEADGNVKNHNPVLDERNVVLDYREFGNLDYQATVEKIAKKQLVQTLQYKSGVLSAENIAQLKSLFFSKKSEYNASKFDNIEYLEQTNVETLSQEELKHYANEQANMLSQLMLFDKTSISKMFLGKQNIFQRVYSWLKNRRNFLKNAARKTDLNKVQYNQVLKTMRSYEDVIAETSPSEQYRDDAIKANGIDEITAKRIRDKWMPTNKPNEFNHWAYVPISGTARLSEYKRCLYELTEASSDRFSFKEAFNPEIYDADFVQFINSITKQGESFGHALQEYMIKEHGFVIDQAHEQLVSVTQFRRNVTAEFDAALDALFDNRTTLQDFAEEFTTVGSLFTDEFNSMIYNESTGNTLNNVRLRFVEVDRAEKRGEYGYTDWNRNEVVIFVDPNVEGSQRRLFELAQIEHTIYHETQHMIADWTNLSQGGDPTTIANGMAQIKSPIIIRALWERTQNLSWEEANALYTQSEIRQMLGQYIYDNLLGEQIAEATEKGGSDIFKNQDYFDIIYDDNGFRVIGYGFYRGFMFSAKYSEQTLSFRKTQQELNRQSRERDNQLKAIEGNTTEEFKEVQKKTEHLTESTRKLLDNRGPNGEVSGVGDTEATNAAIKVVYPNNKFATSAEYADTVLNYGLLYAEMYRMLTSRERQDVNQPHSLEEITSFVDNAIQQNPGLQEQFDKLRYSIERVSEINRRKVFNADYDYSLAKTQNLLRDVRFEIRLDETKQTSIEASSVEGRSGEETIADVREEYEAESKADDTFAIERAKELGLSDPVLATVLDDQMDKIESGLNNPETMEIISSLLNYARQIGGSDGEAIINLFKKNNWLTKGAYLKVIDRLKQQLEGRTLTQEQQTILDTDTSTFEAPSDYMTLIEDLREMVKTTKAVEVKPEQPKVVEEKQPIEKEKPVKQKKQPEVKKIDENVFRVTTAPFYEKEITEKTFNKTRKEIEDYYLDQAKHLAKVAGVEIEVEGVNIGGFTYQEGEKAGQFVNEISYTFVIKDTDAETVTLFAALMGDLAFEQQEATIAANYCADSDPKKDGYSFVIGVKDSKGVLEALDKANIRDYTFDTANKTITLLNFNKENADALEPQIKALTKILGDNVNGYTEANPIISRYLDTEARQDLYREWLKSAKNRREKGSLYSYVTAANERVEQRIKEKSERIEDLREASPPDTATKERIVQQTKNPETIKISQSIEDKKQKLLSFMPGETASEYQGDFTNPTTVRGRREIYRSNEEFFSSLTSDEYQELRLSLFNENTLEADSALDVLDIYAYDHRSTQFIDIKDFVREVMRRKATSAGRELGLLSQTYGNHQIQSFVSEMSQRSQEPLELPIDVLKPVLPNITDVEAFKKSLRQTIDELGKKVNATRDPYEKFTLREELRQNENLLDAIEDNDVARIADLTVTQLSNADTNVEQNTNAISDLFSNIIEYVITHTKTDANGNPTGLSKTRSIFGPVVSEKIINFWSGLNSFRYMMMLSSPKTALKNALSNTMVGVQALVEDKVLSGFEKSRLLQNQTQVQFTGNYDQEFSDYVKDKYLPKIKEKTSGDKYTTSELNKLRQQYAETKDPINKTKLLKKIRQFEQKILNDQPWTQRRTLRNLTNSLAGSQHIILAQAENWLIAKYKNGLDVNQITQQQLLENIRKTNKELADLYEGSINGSLLSTLQLGEKLKLDILDIDNPNSIFNFALYRANKLFFKVDNWATRTVSNLRKNHPMAANLFSFIVPFVRVSANTTMYVLDRSPIGIAKGIMKTLQTRQMYLSDMRSMIRHYYRDQYVQLNSKQNDNFKFKQSEFDNWLNNNIPQRVLQALNGDSKLTKAVYDEMVNNGAIPRDLAGATDPFARATALESLSQGLVGTSTMVLGMLLAAVTGAFDYDDDDDYLGPVIKIGDLKISLEDLAPFSTLFALGAMFTSGKIDKKLDAAFGVIVDQTIFSTLESAIRYSQDLPDYLKNQFINSLTQFLPAFTKNIAKIINGKKDKSGNFGEKLIKTFASNTISLGWLVPNKINPYTGEPQKYYDSGIFEGILNNIIPISFRVDSKSDFEKEAERVGATLGDLGGTYTINDKSYSATGKEKEKLSKFKANYLQQMYEAIISGRQLVTVEDDNGRRITKHYNQLTDAQKAKALKSLYSKATTISKIEFWTSKGNQFIETNRDTWNEYRKWVSNQSNIIFKQSWNKSKFVER